MSKETHSPLRMILRLFLLAAFFQAIALDTAPVPPRISAPTQQLCPPDDPPEPPWQSLLLVEEPPAQARPESAPVRIAPVREAEPDSRIDRLVFSGLSPPGS